MDSMKVFIVDDSEVVQGILVEELSHIQGVQICGVEDTPDDAVSSIQKNMPDLIILDIILKGGNGFEVLKRIREEGVHAKVLVLTNYSFPHYREICRGMGADFFYDKSIDMELALQTVRDMA